MSNDKSGFSLVAPVVPALKKQGTTISICGAQTVTVADLEAALAAQGIVSPNDATLPAKIVRAYGTTAPKGRLTRDQVTDADVTANGAAVSYTDAGGDLQYVHAGEKNGEEVCLIDADCDSVADDVLDPAITWDIPADSCTVFELDYA